MSRATKPRLRAALVAVVVVLALVMAYSIASLFWAVTETRSDYNSTISGFEAGDYAAVDDALVELQASSAELASVTGGSIWSAAAELPLVGKSISALNAMASALVGLSATLEPIAEPLAQASSNSERVARIASLEPELRAFATSASEAEVALAGIDANSLLLGLDRTVGELQAGLPAVAEAAYGLADSSTALGASLGTQGRRIWLVFFENPARDQGSLTGYMLIEFIDGKATVLETETIGALTANTSDQTLLQTASARSDGNLPEVAERVAREMKSQGTVIDGVIAVDADMLASIVASTGPVEHRGVTIDESTTASFFTDDLDSNYPELPTQESKDQLAMGVVSAALIAFVNRPLDLSALTNSAPQRISEGHLRAWSPREDQNEWLRGLGISGER